VSGNPPERGSNAGANAVAAGSGLTLGSLHALLANNLANDNPWKSWLVILAPAAAITLSNGGLAVKQFWDRRTLEREYTARLERAKQTLHELIDNPRTSIDQKEQYQKELDELNMLVVRTEGESLRAIIKRRGSE
jgi:hypothetical protein